MEAISVENKDLASKRAAWNKIIEDYQGSGLSQNKYCEQNNLKKDHLAYYLSKYRRAKAQNQAATFLPIQLGSTESSNFILSIGGGIELQIPSAVSAEQLTTVLVKLRDKVCC